jgi:murein DD-endopeptidase MepM/ murein hydrolase activator NlpD
MAASRLRAVFLFVILALVLTTTACRGASGSRSGHGSTDGVHLPSFSSSHERDPLSPRVTASWAAEHQRYEANMQRLERDRQRLVAEMVASERARLQHPAAFWEAPLTGDLRVTRPFQPPPTRYAAGHRGVDLAGSPGQPVVAAGSGTVTWAGVLAGRGVVVITHGDLRTTYEPVAAQVTNGQPVSAGARIGSLQPGHPGCPVAACLHWGLLRGDEYLDPMLLLNRVVRLLPLGHG